MIFAPELHYHLSFCADFSTRPSWFMDIPISTNKKKLFGHINILLLKGINIVI